MFELQQALIRIQFELKRNKFGEMYAASIITIYQSFLLFFNYFNAVYGRSTRYAKLDLHKIFHKAHKKIKLN